MSTQMIKEINEHLKQLCQVIGARPTGSNKNKTAVEYISSEFKKNEYIIELQEFNCIDWKKGNIELTIGSEIIQASVSDYSLPCDIQAQYECVGNIKELEESDLNNKIAVIYGDLTKEAIMPKNFRFWNPKEHQRIISALEKTNPLAVITVSFNKNIPVPIIEDGDFNIPCAVVSKKEEDILLRSLPKNAKLKITSERKNTKGANVIARNSTEKKKIILTAHLDTKPNTPGALDNASGITTLLVLSNLLSRERINYGLEFVAFNGEDYYSSAGEISYMDNYLISNNNDIFCAINCDGLGLANSKTALSFMECEDNIVNKIKRIMSRYPNIENLKPWYQGDHMMFVMQKIPTITFTSKDVFSLIDNTIHTERDTIELIDPMKIMETASFINDIVKEL